MKKILITNDDGIYADGIQTLARKFYDEGYDVTAVAPDRERSASGHSMTMDRPLMIKEVSKGHIAGGFCAYSCDGTPTDCVIMALDVLKIEPDIILSGINRGPNLADDITYSGTACAAMEGLVYGYPSIAVSLVCGTRSPEKHYAAAADAALKIVRELAVNPMQKDVFYNVNVPNIPAAQLNGVRLTSKGKRYYHDKITTVETPFGGKAYWVGGSIRDDMDEGTDVWAVAHNYISITPVHLQLTSFEALDFAKKTSFEENVFNAVSSKK
ncbi:MAG: 5'/3'-nucleotidase SurE [Cloacibacillus sp.]